MNGPTQFTVELASTAAKPVTRPLKAAARSSTALAESVQTWERWLNQLKDEAAAWFQETGNPLAACRKWTAPDQVRYPKGSQEACFNEASMDAVVGTPEFAAATGGYCKGSRR